MRDLPAADIHLGNSKWRRALCQSKGFPLTPKVRKSAHFYPPIRDLTAADIHLGNSEWWSALFQSKCFPLTPKVRKSAHFYPPTAVPAPTNLWRWPPGRFRDD